MRWIEFDTRVALALIQECRNAALNLRAQGWQRAISANEALDDFYGPYRQVFESLCSAEGSDRSRLARCFEDLSDLANEAISAAQAEDSRRERLYLAALDSPFRTPTDLPDIPEPINPLEPCVAPPSSGTPPSLTPIFPVAPPSFEIPFSVHPRSRIASSHSGTKVGARPTALRAHQQGIASLNTSAKSAIKDVEDAWNLFTQACSWTEAGPLPLFRSASLYLAESAKDEQWIICLADAFESVGGTGTFTDLDISVKLAAVDSTYLNALLSDKTLTADQLRDVATRLAGDSRLAPSLVNYTLQQCRNLGEVPHGDDMERATVLLEVLASKPSLSAAWLKAMNGKEIINLTRRAFQSTNNGSDSGVNYTLKLREVFRKGEPYLAKTDPSFSRKMATSMAQVLTDESEPLNMGGNSLALSFLINESTLSSPFLTTLGTRMEEIERRFRENGLNQVFIDRKLSPSTKLFPKDQYDSHNDPAASLMRAFTQNPSAAHEFFSSGGEERLKYWVECREWSHDKFNGILGALDAAITMDGKAGSLNSGKMASSLVTYLANRTRGTGLLGNPLPLTPGREGLFNGNLGSSASHHLTHILATYMPSVDDTLNTPESPTRNAGVTERITLPGLPKMDNMPRFNIDDLSLLVRSIGSTQEGAVELSRASSNYRLLHFDSIISNHYGRPDFSEKMDLAAESDARFQGFLTHELGEDKIALARQQDDAIKLKLSILKDQISVFPSLSGPAAPIASILAAHPINDGIKIAEEQYAKYEQKAVIEANKTATETLVDRYISMAHLFYESGLVSDDDLARICEDEGLPEHKVREWLSNGFDGERTDPDFHQYHEVSEAILDLHISTDSYAESYEDAFSTYFRKGS